MIRRSIGRPRARLSSIGAALLVSTLGLLGSVALAVPAHAFDVLDIKYRLDDAGGFYLDGAVPSAQPELNYYPFIDGVYVSDPPGQMTIDPFGGFNYFPGDMLGRGTFTVTYDAATIAAAGTTLYGAHSVGFTAILPDGEGGFTEIDRFETEITVEEDGGGSDAGADSADSGVTIDVPAGDYPSDPDLSGITIRGTFPGDQSIGDPDLDYIPVIDGLYVTPDGAIFQLGRAVYQAILGDGPDFEFTFSAAQIAAAGGDVLGPHRVGIAVVRAAQFDDWAEVGRTEVQINVVPGSDGGAPGVEAPGSPGSAGTTSQLASGRADAPSVLSGLVTPANTGLTPERTALTALLTVILLLIVGFPGQLIGSTLSDNYDRVFGWTKPIVAARDRLTSRLRGLPSWAPVALGVALASLISGFVDPQFGFNVGSLRTVISMAIAFVIESVLGWIVIRRVLRRTDPELRPTLEFKPGSLVIVLLAVIVSRLVGFEPGMVFGLIVGLSFGASLAEAREARVTLVGLGWAFGLAVIGWLGYTATTAAWGGDADALQRFVIETLSGLAVSGIAALPLALLPVRSLDGGVIFAWRRLVWAACYAVGLFMFLVVLLPLPFSWGTVGAPFALWVALYVAYALAAVAVWGYFRFRPARTPASDPITETEDAASPTP